MKPKLRKSPLSISLLSIAIIALSLWSIWNRAQFLLSFHQSLLIVDNPDELTIDLNLISGISKLGLSFVPLALGIGLWWMLHWARVLSICLFASIMLPSCFAAVGWIPDGNMSDRSNWAIAAICSIALLILLNPKLSNIFSTRRF